VEQHDKDHGNGAKALDVTPTFGMGRRHRSDTAGHLIGTPGHPIVLASGNRCPATAHPSIRRS
jgi:hypothetical protein